MRESTRTYWGLGFTVLAGILILLTTLLVTSRFVDAQAPPSTMNFQGRLRDSSDQVLPDGLYNMQFRIYDASTGGTALWSESRVGANRVQVTNGLFSTQLGQVNPLPASLFGNPNLYFEVTMATPATATSTSGVEWENPMSPRNKLATSAYAFNSALLNGKSDTDFAAASGSNNYIQNTSSPQNASLNITGTATVGTVRTTNLDTASASALVVGGTNATSVTVAKDMTIAAGKTISMVGGNTSLRPASPSEGTIYFDSETKELLVYADSSWQALNGSSADGKTATVIVGTSASGGTSGAAASQDASSAGFVNSSTTSAQTTINAAIASLPATGGAVYLMEGTYIVDGDISLPNNVSLVGAGNGTIIKIKNAHNANINVITNTNKTTGSQISVQNLKIDGNDANQTAGTQNGIYLQNMGGGSGASAREGAKISNVTVSNAINGIVLSSSSNNSIENSRIHGSNARGLHLLTSSSSNSIVGSTIQGNAQGVLVSAGTGNAFTGNVIQGNSDYGINFADSSANNTFTGNTVRGNTTYGIGITTSANNAVSGNTTDSNGTFGIQLSINSDGNNMTGNVIQNNTSGGVSVANSTRNQINNNQFINNGGSSSTGHSLMIGTSTPFSNSVIGNYFTDTAGGARAINITAGTGTFISDNHFAPSAYGVWHASGPISDVGTGTIYSNQMDGTGKLISRSSGGFAVQNTTGNDVLNVNSSSSLLTVSGTALYRSTANSASAFAVQNSSSIAMFTVDTVNSKVMIGSAANGIEFSANGILLSGTARGTDRMTVSAEYPGLTFRGDGADNNGTLTSDFCSQPLGINAAACSTGVATNFYQWTTDQGSAQDYDLFFKLRYPDRASPTSNGSGVVSFTMDGFVTSTATDSVNATIYKGGATCGTYNVATAGNTWTTTSIAAAFATCDFVSGDEMIVRIKLAAGQNNFARVGDIQLVYRTQR